MDPVKMIAEKHLAELAKLLIDKAESKEYRWMEIGLKKISLRDDGGVEILTLNSEELGIGAIKTIWPTFQKATHKKDSGKLIVFQEGKTAEVLSMDKYDNQPNEKEEKKADHKADLPE